jgi:hypothetical protein
MAGKGTTSSNPRPKTPEPERRASNGGLPSPVSMPWRATSGIKSKEEAHDPASNNQPPPRARSSEQPLPDSACLPPDLSGPSGNGNLAEKLPRNRWRRVIRRGMDIEQELKEIRSGGHLALTSFQHVVEEVIATHNEVGASSLPLNRLRRAVRVILRIRARKRNLTRDRVLKTWRRLVMEVLELSTIRRTDSSALSSPHRARCDVLVLDSGGDGPYNDCPCQSFSPNENLVSLCTCGHLKMFHELRPKTIVERAHTPEETILVLNQPSQDDNQSWIADKEALWLESDREAQLIREQKEAWREREKLSASKLDKLGEGKSENNDSRLAAFLNDKPRFESSKTMTRLREKAMKDFTQNQEPREGSRRQLSPSNTTETHDRDSGYMSEYGTKTGHYLRHGNEHLSKVDEVEPTFNQPDTHEFMGKKKEIRLPQQNDRTERVNTGQDTPIAIIQGQLAGQNGMGASASMFNPYVQQQALMEMYEQQAQMMQQIFQAGIPSVGGGSINPHFDPNNRGGLKKSLQQRTKHIPGPISHKPSQERPLKLTITVLSPPQCNSQDSPVPQPKPLHVSAKHSILTPTNDSQSMFTAHSGFSNSSVPQFIKQENQSGSIDVAAMSRLQTQMISPPQPPPLNVAIHQPPPPQMPIQQPLQRTQSTSSERNRGVKRTAHEAFMSVTDSAPDTESILSRSIKRPRTVGAESSVHLTKLRNLGFAHFATTAASLESERVEEEKPRDASFGKVPTGSPSLRPHASQSRDISEITHQSAHTFMAEDIVAYIKKLQRQGEEKDKLLEIKDQEINQLKRDATFRTMSLDQWWDSRPLFRDSSTGLRMDETQSGIDLGPGILPPTPPRSKTGCLTCRKSKKKCDETKPSC